MLTSLLTYSNTICYCNCSLAANGLTATEGDDFNFNDQSVVFQPGETQKTRQFFITNDTVVETTEFAAVTLTSSDGNVEFGTPSTATISIADNDGTPIIFLKFLIYPRRRHLVNSRFELFKKQDTKFW